MHTYDMQVMVDTAVAVARSIVFNHDETLTVVLREGRVKNRGSVIRDGSATDKEIKQELINNRIIIITLIQS